MAESTATETPDTVEELLGAQREVAPVEKTTFSSQKRLAQPVVQHLRKAGLIESDDDQGIVTILKRVNHAIYANEPIGDIPNLQRKFREELAAAGGNIAKLTEGGAESPVFQINQAYLQERADHFIKSVREMRDVAHPEMGTFEMGEILKRAQEKADKYQGEHDWLQGNPDIINTAVAAHPKVFDTYHNLGEILLLSGIAKGDPAAIREKTDDVMAEVAASRLLDIAPSVMAVSKSKLREYADFPQDYKTSIIYVAEDTALHTTGLERLNLFGTPDATPELKQIQALGSLLSAHLHALTTHNRNSDGNTNPPIEVLANNLLAIPELVRGYQMAGASLVHRFLIDGASAEDAKMKSLDGSFVDLALSRQIPLVNGDSAKRAAAEMVERSATYLRGKFVERPDLLAKVDSLVAQATGKTAEKTFAAGLTPPGTTTFAADAVASKGAIPTL